MLLRRNNRGLTFLELMIVIVIMGILIALVLPNLSGPRAKMALRTSARDIAAAGMLARQRAIVQGCDTYLILNAEENKWRIYTTPPDEDHPRRSDDDLEPTTSEEVDRNLPDVVSFKEFKASEENLDLKDQQRLVFYPNGTCSGMAIQLQNNREKSMTVDFEGYSGLPSVYTGEPKSFAAKLRENGLNPADYGIPDDTIASASGSKPGDGFYTAAGMSSDERVAYYSDIADRLKEQAERKYRAQQEGVGAYYSEAAKWGQ